MNSRWLLVFTLLSLQAFAQEDTWYHTLTEPAYGLWGAGVLARSQNYDSVDDSVSVAPFIFGGYADFFIEGNRFGYSFYRDGQWFASVIGQLRSQNSRQKDTQLGIKERKQALEAGLQVGRRLPYGLVTRLAWLHDISNTHASHEYDLQLYRRDHIGRALLVTTLAVQYQPKKLVSYYYGEQGVENSFAGEFNQEIQGQWVQELELLLTYPVSEDFSAFLGTRNYRYQSDIENSPIADGRNILQGFAGVAYRF